MKKIFSQDKNKCQEIKDELADDNITDEEIEAFVSIVGEDYATAEGFEESRQGKYRNDEDFTQELVESIGDLPKDLAPYIHIDWESTARDIMMDYSEENGYYFRNL